MINIPVSVGELVDKITILMIKKSHILDTAKIEKVEIELRLLNSALEGMELSDEYIPIMRQLIEVNTKLWNVEDTLRDYERRGEWQEEFIQNARSVYFLNDERFVLKDSINKITNSYVQEVKSYSKY